MHLHRGSLPNKASLEEIEMCCRGMAAVWRQSHTHRYAAHVRPGSNGTLSEPASSASKQTLQHAGTCHCVLVALLQRKEAGNVEPSRKEGGRVAIVPCYCGSAAYSATKQNIAQSWKSPAARGSDSCHACDNFSAAAAKAVGLAACRSGCNLRGAG